MTNLMLSAEQIKNAPREVKEWIKMVLFSEFSLEPESGHDRREAVQAGLAECSLDEAGLVLEQIRDDYIACQVFFELGRESLHGQPEPPDLHRTAIADMLRHTRLGDREHLAACLDRIGEAFHAVRGDPQAPLFAFDRADNLYVHSTTQRSIKALWQAIVTSRMLSASELPGMASPAGPAVPVDTRSAV